MRNLLFMAVSLALSAGVSAQALTTTQTKGFSVSTSSVSDTVARTPSNASQMDSFSYPAMTFEKFQAATGVLTGVSSNVSITAGTVTLSASGTPTGTGTAQFGSTGNVYARGYITGGNSNFLPATILNETLSNSCNAGAPCFPSGVTNLSQNGNLTKTDSTWLSPAGTFTPGTSTPITAYAGTGTLSTTLAIQNSLILETGSASTFVATPRATQTITGLAGDLSLNYAYLRHADASFNSGANTDQRTIAAGSGFSIFNLGDASTTKLDYVSRSCTGDCGDFTITMASFQNLSAGSSIAGTTALTASAKSTSTATYLFTFSDDTAVGATNTHLRNTVQLTVGAVPEPAEWAMLMAGLLVVGFIARRRRQFQ